MRACAKDCPDRSITCHATCQFYKAERARLDEINNRKKQDNETITQLSKELEKKFRRKLRWK